MRKVSKSPMKPCVIPTDAVHKQIEKTLAHSKEYYRLLAQSAHDVIWVFDLFGHLIYISPSVERLRGYTPEECMKQGLADAMTPESARIAMEDTKRIVAQTALGGRIEAGSLELEMICRDGSTVWIELISDAMLDESGNLVGIQGISRDITERKRTEEALRASEERFRSLVETTSDWVWETDAKGLFSYVSPKVKELLGYEPEEVVGRSPLDLMPPDEAKRLAGVLKEYVRNRRPFTRIENWNRHKNGQLVLLETSGVPLVDNHGLLCGYRGIDRDITGRKQAEGDLLRSLSLLNATLDSTADGILVVDGGGRVVNFNKKFVEMWHIPDNVIATKKDDLVLTFVLDQLSNPDEFMAKVRELYGHPETESSDILNFKDSRVFERYSCPQYLGDTVAGRVWSFRDVTERKRAEKSLKENAHFLQTLIDAIPNPIFVKDLNGTYQGCNVAFESYLGLNKSEIVGKSVYDLAPQELADRYHEMDMALFRQGGVQVYESSVLYADGTIHNVIFNKATYSNSAGNMRGLVGVLLDITARKKMEDDLLRERNQLKTLLNFYRRPDMQVHDIVAFIVEECIRMTESRLGFFGFINEDETLMTAHLWSEEAMKGCAIDFKPVEFSITHAGIWAEAIRKHEPLIVNDYLKPDPRKKGYPEGHVPIQRLMSIPIIKGTKVVAVMAVANKEMNYTDAELLHISLFVESMMDMIRRKKAEEELLKLNNELEERVDERTKQLKDIQEELVRKEKLSILGQLAGIVGHEIRNPLGIINNAVYFLKTIMPNADNMVKEYLDIIKQEIDNSQRIITDLLDFSRTKIPQIIPIEVNALVAEVFGKCPSIPENINVKTDISDTLPQAYVDPFQIGQILENLITNAIQAMPEGGTLTVAARRVARHRPRAASRDLSPERCDVLPEADTDFIEISVKDTGSGISEDNMKNLFQPLFTTKTKGIGLGLVVCKNLVEANGGAIEVESELGRGTTFLIMLPQGGLE